MNSVRIRVGLVVTALLAGGWLAVGVRGLQLESESRAVIDRARAGPVSPEEVSGARVDLNRARRFSPDQGAMIREGELLNAIGQDRDATALGRRVVADEPDNLEGWFLIWVTEQDARGKKQAERRLLELNPWFKRALRRR